VSYNITDVREMSHANRTVVQFICWAYCSIHANAVKLNDNNCGWRKTNLR